MEELEAALFAFSGFDGSAETFRGGAGSDLGPASRKLEPKQEENGEGARIGQKAAVTDGREEVCVNLCNRYREAAWAVGNQ